MTMYPAISIVMPCYNGDSRLQRVLENYDRQSAEGFEIIGVDDCSTDSTREILTGYRPRRYTLRPIGLEKNGGPARARNAAIPLTRAPLVLFVGDDIVPHGDFVRWHLEAHEYYPEPTAAILGHTRWPDDMPINTLMAHIDGRGAQQFSYHYLINGGTYDHRHFYTSNVSLKRQLLATVDHWFDPDFTFAAFEDVELGFRLAEQGMTIRYLRAPEAYHYHYHTIWSFAARQRRVGLMARVLVGKHPRLLRLFDEELRRMDRYCREAPKARSLSIAPWLEAETLKLASSYEWSTHPRLEELYRESLQYFCEKGMIDAYYAGDPGIGYIHAVHAQLSLAPLLAGFLRDARPWPFPVGYGSWLRDQCATLSRAA
jgi:glycosyltransferase involved in cell wall biosynthesis